MPKLSRQNRSLLKAFFVISLFFLMSSGCRKDCWEPTNPECENYDPCYGKRATADFTINQYNGWVIDPNYRPEYCDTILGFPGGGGAEFTALMPNAEEYLWQIGTDSREFNKKQISLLFNDWLKDTLSNLSNNPDFYKPIPVTLSVKNPAGNCIPDKDTIVTFSKDLVFTRKSLTWGFFKGACDIDNKERIIEFRYHFDSLEQNDFLKAKLLIINTPHKDTIAANAQLVSSKLRSYKQYWWDNGSDYYTWNYDGMNKWKIYVEPKPDGREEVTIEYRYTGENDTEPQNVIFKGIRID